MDTQISTLSYAALRLFCNNKAIKAGVAKDLTNNYH